ncbi:TPA: hypothetical protein MEE01_005646 [Klebsiella pneumoniae]|nr:hypothetical protein [Klebsiella pneumoniae]
MVSYIEEVKVIHSLVKKANGADEEKLQKAEGIFKRIDDLAEEAYLLIAEAYQTTSNEDLELENNIHAQFVFINNFDDYEVEETEKGENRQKELLKISLIDPSGFTETNKELHGCAGKIVKRAKEVFKSEPVAAEVWSYRWGGYNIISCDLCSLDQKISMPITISAVERQMLEYFDEPEVFDMAEALHLVGIVTQALGANIKIGLGGNEVNPDVLSSPLKEGATNGRIHLWEN